MQVSYKWLSKLVDLQGISPEELAEKLTRAGLEVEGIEHPASGTNLVIGCVEECVKHPDSDHLHVCQVNTGSDRRQIVCGAPNVAAGEKVIVALPGSVLPGGTISDSRIRGVDSFGMLCSLAELGVDKKNLTEKQLSGIELLPADAPVGDPEVLKYLGLDDSVLELSLTPNRADCLSMWALAKETGAVLDRAVILPDYHCAAKESPATLKIILKTGKCSRFLGKLIGKVTIKESPDWIRELLHSAGVKSINNVVDISNLVMLETGQPLHFYDAAKIPGAEITVADGLKEKYTALDGVGYQLEPEDIVIMNSGKAIGIAGIMGGDDSKIDEATHGIIIESALFDGVTIRNTSRRLNLMTEAAVRFSKPLDPEAAYQAVERSVQLLVKYADAQGIEETVIAGDPGHDPKTISLSTDKVNAVLGTHFSQAEIMEPLRRLDLTPAIENGIITVQVPSYRANDLKIPEDIIEEIIRIRGFDNITSTLPLMPQTIGGLEKPDKQGRVIKSVLNGMGLQEIITYSLVSARRNQEAVLPLGEALELLNPISDDRRYYRVSLTPSMLETLAFNQAHYQNNYGLFEIADVYDKEGRSERRLSLAISNKIIQSDWQKLAWIGDFYILKGMISAFLDELGYNEKRIRFSENKSNIELFHPQQSAEIYLDHKLIGVFGRIHPAAQKTWGLDRCVLGELRLSEVFKTAPSKIRFIPVPRYPDTSYDLAMVVDNNIPVERIISLIGRNGTKFLSGTKIFDVYQGGNIGAGKKSVAVRLTFMDSEKTIRDQDIKPILAKIIESLRKELGAEIRDS